VKLRWLEIQELTADQPAKTEIGIPQNAKFSPHVAPYREILTMAVLKAPLLSIVGVLLGNGDGTCFEVS
jgi:hypothetical protein